MNEDALQEIDRHMADLADGNRSASSFVFSALWPRLVAFAERTLGPGPDADDAAQQALEKIFAQAGRYDPARSALAWALAVTSWECRTLLKRRRRRREETMEAAQELEEPREGPDEQAMTRALLSALDVAVAGLSDQDRKTLRQAFFEEAGGGAVDPAFRKRKQRTLERLRIAWSRLYGR